MYIHTYVPSEEGPLLLHPVNRCLLSPNFPVPGLAPVCIISQNLVCFLHVRRHIYVYQLFPRHLFAIRLTPQFHAFQKRVFQDIYIKASRTIFITYVLREYPNLVTKIVSKNISHSPKTFSSEQTKM